MAVLLLLGLSKQDRMDQLSSPLTRDSFSEGITCLAKIDPDLGAIITRLGNPPLWAREPGFATILLIILEQQVSLASAKATYDKLLNAAGLLTANRFLAFKDVELRQFGFSRQKANYGRELAKSILNGSLNPDELQNFDDSRVKNSLMAIKGIGPWTADIYLLMVLLRPDIWPSGDLALAKAVQKIKCLEKKPTPPALDEIAEQWRPWRAVAARILWLDYLN